ncbi:fam-a protein [Plasmodium berghei]|uniref:Fam-a protein n=2 Tax=Plasmodium berghei TaxID=5821 RepID=A0A509AQS9_PLABA|nr:fam-a protein [Plasmodium berghei ANKA]CXJ06159.1 fam-a protein [Plasmodium berghei]SCL83368.1 fam-a protein [Plasmodium berghei]SCL98920.1 fam-a protein [Plasmodium berghei]SCM16930.1 fam-a protein [Plasmodium berghei]SCN28164.1 fam-a protein [Plasmodium berghei]|eukprot:XP_034423812.1 fam-a protein [Plasmodium berghei ANKA]
MNKGYIKIVFCLLSMLICMNNNILASEDTPEVSALRKYALRSKARRNVALRKNIPHNISPCELYEQNIHLLCTKYNETKKATKLMDEAVELLQQYATDTSDYYLYSIYEDDVFLYFNKHVNPCVGKLKLKISAPDAYEDIINLLWNPNAVYHFCKDFANGKVVRVYDPSLVIIQHRYINHTRSIQGYFYSLAKKVEISKYITIIVMASANINDYNAFDKNIYKNTIIESANLFKIDIDSEDDIRNGKLIKMFVNLSGFIIKKEDTHVDITHIDSIEFNCPNVPWWYIRKAKAIKMLDFSKLKQLFDEK